MKLYLTLALITLLFNFGITGPVPKGSTDDSHISQTEEQSAPSLEENELDNDNANAHVSVNSNNEETVSNSDQPSNTPTEVDSSSAEEDLPTLTHQPNRLVNEQAKPVLVSSVPSTTYSAQTSEVVKTPVQGSTKGSSVTKKVVLSQTPQYHLVKAQPNVVVYSEVAQPQVYFSQVSPNQDQSVYSRVESVQSQPGTHLLWNNQPAEVPKVSTQYVYSQPKQTYYYSNPDQTVYPQSQVLYTQTKPVYYSTSDQTVYPQSPMVYTQTKPVYYSTSDQTVYPQSQMVHTQPKAVTYSTESGQSSLGVVLVDQPATKSTKSTQRQVIVGPVVEQPTRSTNSQQKSLGWSQITGQVPVQTVAVGQVPVQTVAVGQVPVPVQSVTKTIKSSQKQVVVGPVQSSKGPTRSTVQSQREVVLNEPAVSKTSYVKVSNPIVLRLSPQLNSDESTKTDVIAQTKIY